MMNKDFFHILPYSRSLTAHVAAVDSWKNQPALVLDCTIFYPEGGGQPGDRGIIRKRGIDKGDSLTVQVVATITDEASRILHILDKETSLVPGDDVTLELDWGHRYAYMQMHTAQHMISGLAHTLFGIGTLSVHQGAEGLTIETDRSDIPMETIIILEEAVTCAIHRDIPVISREVSHAEATRLGLRRSIKVEGDVRIVSIEGIDLMACGGVHVARTGEVRAVRYAGSESVRSHVRMKWLTGDSVLETERQARAIIGELTTVLSAPPEDIVSSVTALQVSAMQSRHQAEQAMEEAAFLHLLAKAASTPDTYGGTPVVTWDVPAASFMELKHVAAAIPACGSIILCATRETEGKTAWCIALKDAACNFETIRTEVLLPLGAKGGGKSPLWQGIAPVPAVRLIEDFLNFMKKNKSDRG
ncbi:alanyl-tRNA editing protein [Parasphaerochaeta coccoides]|nr:alanyl-tRNA editing protein [Parasphaerochaeta coccoides]